MRYAVVIEKAEGTIRPTYRTCQAAWQPLQRSTPIEREIHDAIRFHMRV